MTEEEKRELQALEAKAEKSDADKARVTELQAKRVPAEPKRTAAEVLEEIRSGVKSANERGEKLEKENAELKKQMAELQTKSKKRTAGAARSGFSLPGVELEKEKFSFIRAIKAIRDRNPDVAPFEWDVMQQTVKHSGARALSTDVDSAGGFLVPEQVMPDFIELLDSMTVAFELGASAMNGLVGSPVRLIKQTAGSTAYWVAENAAITESQQTLGAVELRPREAAALVPISNQLLARANPSVEALVRREIASRIARLIDLAVLQGTGGTQPLGILGTTNVGSSTVNAVPNEDDLFDMLLTIENADVEMQGPGWAMAPRTWNSLRKLKNGQGDHILIPSLANPKTGTLLGFPYRTTTQIPTNLGGTTDESRLYLGDWPEVLVGRWGGLEIATSTDHSNAFSQNQTFIRIIAEVDVALRHGEAFVVDSTIRV